MDLDQVIAELRAEMECLDKAIGALSRLESKKAQKESIDTPESKGPGPQNKTSGAAGE